MLRTSPRLPKSLRYLQHSVARASVLVTGFAAIGLTGSLVQLPAADSSPAARKFLLNGWSNNCGWEANVGGYDYYGSYPPKHDLCIRPGWDQSIYTSAGMHLNGRLQQARAEFTFFLVPKHLPPRSIVALPVGMHITGTHVKFDCAGGKSPMEKVPYDCRPYSKTPRVRAVIDFPYCWSGQGLTDVVYSISGVCPRSHPKGLPLVRVDITWNAANGKGATFTGGKMKATFTNGYERDEMAEVVHDCINLTTPCGAFTNYINRDWPT